MIVDGLLDLVQAVLSWMVGLLPLDGIDYGAIGQYTQWAQGLGIFFPVGTIAAAVAIIVTWEVSIGAVRIILWVYRHVPIVGAG